MPIELTCPCGKRLQVEDEHAGKRGQCPACGVTFQIPGRDACATTASPESAQAVIADHGLEAVLGPGWLEHAVTPPAQSTPDLLNKGRAGLKEGDNTKLTGVGCVLTLLTVAVTIGVAIPIVRWRDPATGQPLPRTVAIFSPLLIGAALHGIATLLLRFIGVRVWSKEKGADGKEIHHI